MNSRRVNVRNRRHLWGGTFALGSMGGGSKGQLEICLQSGGAGERLLSGSLIAWKFIEFFSSKQWEAFEKQKII